MKVVFSSRAFVSLLVEVREKITTETGGVFLGFYNDDIWYVIESVDPGPNSIFKPAYFEYDTPYINHLINKVSRIYRTQLELVGLWHRHPGSFDLFSGTDDRTNTEYAKLSSEGAISGLVNIDPDFRLTMYHVSLPLSYQKIPYEVDDEKIPKEVAELHEYHAYKDELSHIQEKVMLKSRLSFENLVKSKKRKETTGCFGDAIHTYLKKRTMSNVKAFNPYNYEIEFPMEEILEILETDLQYMKDVGINYSMQFSAKLLEITGTDDCGRKPWKLLFGKDKEEVVFQYNEIVFRYNKGLLKILFEEYMGQGR